MITKKCLSCRSSFTIYNRLDKIQKFCSRKCVSQYQKILFAGKNNPFYGRKHTNKTKNKIRISKLGKIPWNKGLRGYGAGKNHPMKKPEIVLKSKLNRKGLTEKGLNIIRQKMIDNNPVKKESVRKKISNTLTGKPQPWNRGKNCNFWKGGIAKSNVVIKNSLEYKKFIKTVFYRDGYRCRRCNKYGGKLNVHHIKNFSQHKHLQTVVCNGITLCLYCHRLFHKRYGIQNNTSKQIKKFINS